MSGTRFSYGLAAIMVFALSATSCGGGDDEPSVADAPATDGGNGSAAVPADSDLGDADSGDSSGSTPNCDAIFPIGEIEELFAEPAELTENTNASLGQLVCTWETIEDPEDVEDVAYKILVVQVYSGSGVPASTFFDPSIFESPVMIDGIGDLAYSSNDTGTDFYFVDGPVGGSLSYVEADFGDFDAPKLHPREDVEQLFREFHDRVT